MNKTGYALIKLGHVRLKHDFGAYTGWTQSVKAENGRIVVDVAYSYPEGPLYQESKRMSFLLEGATVKESQTELQKLIEKQPENWEDHEIVESWEWLQALLQRQQSDAEIIEELLDIVTGFHAEWGHGLGYSATELSKLWCKAEPLIAKCITRLKEGRNECN